MVCVAGFLENKDNVSLIAKEKTFYDENIYSREQVRQKRPSLAMWTYCSVYEMGQSTVYLVPPENRFEEPDVL